MRVQSELNPTSTLRRPQPSLADVEQSLCRNSKGELSKMLATSRKDKIIK